MLSQKELEIIRGIKSYEIYFYEENGIPIKGRNKKIPVPTSLELRSKAFEEILKIGFYHIKFASPDEANCIVRIFKKEHHPLGLCTEQIHNLWGFNCFTKKDDGTWTSISEKGRPFDIDFSKCEVNQWLNQNELISYKCDFFDSYVLIE